jgi:ribose 5-phosphate isomerase B
MIVAIGCDHNGYAMKSELANWLRELGHESLDCGTNSTEPVDYVDYAVAVARAVTEKRATLGILVCGTGQGDAMAANKIHGIRAALCTDSFSARRTREHNDANMLVMGAWIIGMGVARDCVEAFLATPFSHEERHVRRLAKIALLEQTT